MFKNNFVVAVKADSKILKEDKESVFIPFSKEYSLLFKNLNNVKAVVSVSIDGEDVLSGKRLVVDPNSNYELKRMITDNISVHSNSGYAFRFIEKTDQISEYRGDKADDGIIRVEVTYVKPVVSSNWPLYNNNPFYGDLRLGRIGGQSVAGGHSVMDSMEIGSSVSYGANVGSTNLRSAVDAIPKGSLSSSVQANTAGITTKGSEVEQSFTQTNVGALEDESTVITLQLVGKVGDQLIDEVAFVPQAITCEVCGQKTPNRSPSRNNYCSNCGTNLQ